MKIYLACPFSSRYFWVRWYRAFIATKCAAAIMMQGYVVFSPITHSLPIAWFLPKWMMQDHAHWMHQDLPLVDWCDRLVIIKLKDWRKSKGVQREHQRAANNFKPVIAKTPKEILAGQID